ncbi:hypothetical protein CRENBAI_010863, partial [Crenichthys baileyi]
PLSDLLSHQPHGFRPPFWTLDSRLLSSPSSDLFSHMIHGSRPSPAFPVPLTCVS